MYKRQEKRILLHNSGKVQATKPRRPMRLVFYEAFLNKYDVLRRESFFKSSKGKVTFKKLLKEAFQTK